VTRLIVRVDGAGSSAVKPDERVIDIQTDGTKRNVVVDPDQVVQAFLAEVPPRCRDLLKIAGAIYAADGRVKRGRISDPFDDTWRRTFSFHVAVHDFEFWSDPEVSKSLRDAIEFVSGDAVDFVFSKASGAATAKQSLLPMNMVAPQHSQANVIVLLSGGLDSLAATLQARQSGLNPLLVSHRSAPQILARQENLVGLLRARDALWSYPHVSLLLHNVGSRPQEFTQRTRSFLFAAIAAVVAQHLGIGDVRMCDNGVVSLNLPPSGQSVGTTLSRSTHPGFLQRLEPFLRKITENTELRVSNTLLQMTKREIVDLVAEQGAPELIQETVSCAHTERRTKGQPHCGLCTQCIDRRFATIAAGMEAHDLPERYESDIFTSELKEGRDRTHAENYLRLAHELRSYRDSPARFFIERISDFSEALPETDVEQFHKSIYDLFQRHQCDVHAVLTRKIEEHAADLAVGELPEYCMLRLTNASDVKTPPRERYVARLAQILSESLPISFQSGPPENERAMQDAGEAALNAAAERLDREAPQVPFGSVSVRPDFSKRVNSSDSLYIEFKLIKHKRDRNRVHQEIAADVTNYPEECHLLFIVYDSARALADPGKLKRDIESKRQNAVLYVVR